jgi:Streptomyces sporulation and cell division protein, SsgA
MAGEIAEVRAELTLRLVAPRADVELDATLRYTADDPYAVHLSFPTAPGQDGIEWMFARQLVADGLTAPAGDGDVRIWPSPDDPSGPVYVELCSPSGRALFAIGRDVLADFVQRSLAVVPTGDEGGHLDLDAELDLLLHDDLS